MAQEGEEMRYTKDEIEAQCQEDHKRYQGNILTAAVVYTDGGREICPEIHPKSASIRVLVLGDKNFDPHWKGEGDEAWCETQWEVEHLDDHPELDALDKNDTIWINGVQRFLNGVVSEPLWEFDSDQKLPRKHIERKCLEDYRKYAGKIVLATSFCAVIDHDSHDIDLDEPIRVRIWDKMSDESVINWNDDYCDPYWDVELLEPHDELDKASSVWIDGISRSAGGDVNIHRGWEIDHDQSLSRHYVERQCWAEYEKHAGQYLLVTVLHGHLADNNVDFFPERAVRVRVIEHQRESDILEWHEADDLHDVDLCSPFWDVELAESPFDNETEYADESDRLWVMAPHLTIMGDWGDPVDWELDPNQAPLTEDAARDIAVLTTCPYCGQQLLLTIKKATTSSTS